MPGLLDQEAQPIKGTWPNDVRTGSCSVHRASCVARAADLALGIYPQNTEYYRAKEESCGDNGQRSELCAGHVLVSGAILARIVHTFCTNRPMASRPKPMTSVMAFGSISSMAATKKSARSNHLAVRRK